LLIIIQFSFICLDKTAFSRLHVMYVDFVYHDLHTITLQNSRLSYRIIFYMKFALLHFFIFIVGWSGEHPVFLQQESLIYTKLFYLLFFDFSQLRELLSSEGVTDENKELLDVSQKPCHFQWKQVFIYVKDLLVVGASSNYDHYGKAVFPKTANQLKEMVLTIRFGSCYCFCLQRDREWWGIFFSIPNGKRGIPLESVFNVWTDLS